MLILSLLSAAMVPSAVCRAQEGTEKAEKLMKEYRFEEALDALEKLLPEEILLLSGPCRQEKGPEGGIPSLLSCPGRLLGFISGFIL